MAASVAKTRITKRQGRPPKPLGRLRALERPEPSPEPVATKAPPRVADWRLTLLRLAIEQALNAELSLPLRLHLTDAQRSLRSDLYGTVATAEAVTHTPIVPNDSAPAAPVMADPEPTQPSPERTKRQSDATKIARSFRGDKYRELFNRAIEAGWSADPSGSHVWLYGPDGGRFSLSTTAISDRGHGFRNVKAQAKRQGLNVDGI